MPPGEAPVQQKPQTTAPVQAEPKPLVDMTRPDQPSETDILVQKIKAAREAEKNKKKEQVEEKLPPAEPLPSIGGPKSGLPSLGGVGMRKGAFDLDPEYLKRAQADLDRLNPKQEETKKEDGRSMLEVMREKREKAERDNAEKKKELGIVEGGETVEQRKARLLAQRDLLRKAKQEKREAELKEFNEKMGLQDGSAGQKSLFDQFKKLDEEKKAPVFNAGVAGGQMVDANLERRRQIYKNVRKDIERDEEAKKELQYQRKMTELEKKAQERELSKQEQQQLEAERAAASLKQKQEKENESKSFLDNIKTFKID